MPDTAVRLNPRGAEGTQDHATGVLQSPSVLPACPRTRTQQRFGRATPQESTFVVSVDETLTSEGTASALAQSTGSGPASSGSTPMPTSNDVGVSPLAGRDHVMRPNWGRAVESDGWRRKVTVAGAEGAVAPTASAASITPAAAIRPTTPNRKIVALT